MGYLASSALVASSPIIMLVVALCVFKVSAVKAAFLASISAFIVALLVYRAPFAVVLLSYLYGAAFGLWPIAWIVVNAMFLYRLSEETGSLEDLRRWMESNLPNERSLVALFTALLFGGLVEGVDGYGFPVAITASLLSSLGLSPFKSVIISLIANTVTVPFASLGVPVATLAKVTGLELRGICTQLSVQLTVYSVVISGLIIATTSGFRRLLKFLDVTLVAGLSMGLAVYVASAYLDPNLSGVLAPLTSMVTTLGYLRVRGLRSESRVDLRTALRGWLPWVLAVTILTGSSLARAYTLVEMKLPILGLHGEVKNPLYESVYQAVYEWQLVAHGTLILAIALVLAFTAGLKFRSLLGLYVETWRRMGEAVAVIIQVLGASFLMNYSGLSLTLGYALSMSGPLFPMLSGFIGWLGTFVSGSVTGSNAFFGNLQRVSAELLGFPPVLAASLNSTGGIFGKIISLQSVAVGASAVKLKQGEGEVVKTLLPYSLGLTLSLGVLAYLQVWYQV